MTPTKPIKINRLEPLPVFKCPMCQSADGLYQTSTVTGTGCLVSLVLLVLFFPLCWLGLAFRRKETFCKNCKMRLP